jgi:non-heme chloroperoxidase
VPTYLARDGAELHYLESGLGDPIVFVHGWTMSADVWRHQIDHFSQTHRVIAPDLRGCGGSPPTPGRHNVPNYSDDIADLVRHLGLRRPHLVGWSMGGAIVSHYLATQSPPDVASIGLVDFPPKLDEEPTVADKVCHNLNKRRESWTSDFVRRMFLRPDDASLGFFVQQALRCTTETACEMYRAMRLAPVHSGGRPSATHAYLAFPDQGWFRPAIVAWKSSYPDHVAPTFAASKHNPFWEEAARFNETYAEFLRRA